MTLDSKRIQMDSDSNQIGKRYFLFLIIFFRCTFSLRTVYHRFLSADIAINDVSV